MEKEQIKNIIEAILFTFSDPMDIKELREIINSDMDLRELKNIIEEIKMQYKNEKRGIQILRFENKYQMATNREYAEYVKKLFEPKKKKSLTQAALETLTIIAYKQPITKVEVEEIRGVKCDKAMATLMEYDLICEAGRLDRIGKPIIYKTTEEFLKVFGLEGLKDLPDMNTLQEEEKEA